MKKFIPTVELLYLCDDDFKKDIDQLRERYKLSVKQGEIEYTNCLDFDQKLLNDKYLFDDYNKQIKAMANKYDLNGSELDIEIFLESGIAPYSEHLNRGGTIVKFNSLELQTTNPGMRRKNYIPGSPVWIRFKVRKPIKVNELMSWLNSKKGEIVSMVNDHFCSSKPAIIKLEKLDRLLEIIKMRDVEHKTYKEVADVLCEKYPDDPDVVDGKVNEQSIKMLYGRYRKKSHELK